MDLLLKVLNPFLLIFPSGLQEKIFSDPGGLNERSEDLIRLPSGLCMEHAVQRIGPVGIGSPLIAMAYRLKGCHFSSCLPNLFFRYLPKGQTVEKEPGLAMIKEPGKTPHDPPGKEAAGELQKLALFHFFLLGQ
jgi:hypothetical protein